MQVRSPRTLRKNATPLWALTTEIGSLWGRWRRDPLAGACVALWLAAGIPETRRSGLGFSGVSGLCRYIVGCWPVLCWVGWPVRSIDHVDYHVGIVYSTIFCSSNSHNLSLLSLFGSSISCLFYYISYHVRGYQFGSDGDWGGIYVILRALFFSYLSC